MKKWGSKVRTLSPALSFVALGLGFAVAAWAGAEDTFFLRNVDVYPVAGPAIKSGAVRVEDGKIAEVGARITPPKGIRIVDGKGLRVYPGMIDSGTQLGLSEISDLRVTVDTGELGVFMPQLRALVAVNPESEHFPVVRANGITSVVTFPASGGGGGAPAERQIIAGQAAVIHSAGWTWEEMEVKRSAAIHLIFPQMPRNLAGNNLAGNNLAGANFTDAKRAYDQQIQRLTEFFDNARRYRDAKAAGGPSFRIDLKLDAMIPVLDGKVPVAVSAARERSIRDAIQFAEKQKIRMVLLQPRELEKVSAELKARNIPVVLGRTFQLPENEDDPYDSSFTLPGEALKAGLKFAFGTFDNEFVRDLPYEAAAAVAFGLPYEEALKSMTIHAAQIWGVSDQIGSIEKGKWADLMLATGDPLETTTEVKALYIKGREVDLSNRQTRLYEKYLGRK